MSTSRLLHWKVASRFNRNLNFQYDKGNTPYLLFREWTAILLTHRLSLCGQQKPGSDTNYPSIHYFTRCRAVKHYFPFIFQLKERGDTRRWRRTVERRGSGEKKVKRFPMTCKSPAATAGHWPIISSGFHDEFDAMQPMAGDFLQQRWLAKILQSDNVSCNTYVQLRGIC